ncbi:beta-glucuronidase [Pseudoclavibacter sp. RFBB5]|uniref:beta-glucuronidase n=1 Tax=Pseudoclavibacter sp. RFBB5 TaxID=2080574 RepID=UPI000CE935A0|nr:beta-glucuronidase [Pseudoclavibacter sp. RFBB5]PPG33501.1 beta-glucuronidase [Pseudoclavibacter sp. RFBB5]
MLRAKSTPTREVVSLDGLWKFAVRHEPTAVEDWAKRFDPRAREAAVPASYNDLFADQEIHDHVGWVTYQKTVRIPAGWAAKEVVIRFDAATHEAIVWADGHEVAHHVGGYTPFEAVITDFARPGEEVTITVAVNNQLTLETIPPGEISQRGERRTQTYRHDFFNYAGLTRSVWLCGVPKTRIVDVTVTTRLESGVARIGCDVRLSETAESSAVQMHLRIKDAEGAVVATAGPGADTLSLDAPTLWRPGCGYLYELEATAMSPEGETLDVYSQPFGVRTVEVRGTEFLINGEPFYFTGFGRHEDLPVFGRGHSDAHMVHDFALMTWMGANSFRTSHYPYAEDVLDYADRAGIVVIDESAAVGLNTAMGGGEFGHRDKPTYGPDYVTDATRLAHEQHLRELIARDKNHPSVVLWSVANEPDSCVDGAREYFEPIVALTRELDPTRPVTFAHVALPGAGDDRIADLFDVLCLNRYAGWYFLTGDLAVAEKVLSRDLGTWAKNYRRPIIMTEYGADTVAGLHTAPAQPWSEEYQRDFLETYHRVFDSIPEVVGEQIWNFADFATQVTTHRVDGNRKGMFTRDRKPKSAVADVRRRWLELKNRASSTPTTDPETTAEEQA